MKRRCLAVLVFLCATLATGCGKVASGVLKGAARGGAKAAPKAAPVIRPKAPMTVPPKAAANGGHESGIMNKFGKEAGQQGIQSGLGQLTGDKKDKKR